MPSKQSHRGAHPQDKKLFASKCVPRLRSAVTDLSYLLSRGYSDKAARTLVGDHYQLSERQRRALAGAACSDESLARRARHRVALNELAGEVVVLDGYNVLILAESVLGGGVLLRGRDGCIRDLASVHGSYRRVAETDDAIALIGGILEEARIEQAIWYFDAPVSNSGRLKIRMAAMAEEKGWAWDLRLIRRVDQTIAASEHVVISSDSYILDRAARWAHIGDALALHAKRVSDTIDLA